MKIVYVGMRYDYGDPRKGGSFERINILDSLVKMENGRHHVVEFAFDERIMAVGREAMNKELVSLVQIEKPDLCFFFLFNDEIFPETIQKISSSGTLTFNWFADDHWRFANFSRHYAPYFDWVSTTDSKALLKYKAIGCTKVIKTQWACNPALYVPFQGPFEHDVSFVGQPHGNRRQIVERLKKNNVAIDCFGAGWEKGRIEHEAMVRVFSTSKINVNLTKSSGSLLRSIAKIFFVRQDGKIRLVTPHRWFENIESLAGRFREQIKGRNFEIPGSGGFLLTANADNLSDYYIFDKEIVCFKSEGDLLDKIRYYLTHETERAAIARAGYDRTMRDHTYEKRFQHIFKEMSLYE